MLMTHRCTIAMVALLMLLGAPAYAAPSQEERRLDELRNTVVNLLQALVEKGVVTRQQAEAMVKAAEDKATADAAASAAAVAKRDKEEEGAIRVPYVPEIVKDEIRKEVADQLAPEVAQQVITQAKSEQWAVPGALPDWIKRVTIGGDLRVRGEGDTFAPGNAPLTYLNFNAVNSAGGIAKAGTNAFINSSTNRYYLVGRLRLNLDADLSSGWGTGMRLTTGNLANPDSTNQVLGQYGNRYQTDVDLAYIKWAGASASGRQQLHLWAGKFPNPYLSTDILWDTDVTFEGAALNYQFGLWSDAPKQRFAFATLGAIPVQEVALSSNDKWLYAAQTGVDFRFTPAVRARLGVAYYYYKHLHGEENSPSSNLLDYTAPVYLQKGNTLFDIRNDQDPATNLFALAADYHLLDVVMVADWNPTPAYRLSLTADYVKNIGYKESDIAARIGSLVPARVKAYQGELAFGSATFDHRFAWRSFLAYKYIQRDAVLDAFDDQDFHLGGTDAKGYIVGADFALTPRVWTRGRYISSNAIDGAPLGIDLWQLELNAQF